MKEVVNATGVRRLIGNFGGRVKDVPAHKLGELVVREVITRADVDPLLIDEVVVSCVGQSSDAHNVARLIGLMAGLPMYIPAYSIPRNLSSSPQPFVNAYQNIRSEDVAV